ncbi:MAG: replication-associated recombination protein A [Planctomycetes bacterium]|nr:replication-associated recombination protein A [Planctomycetota bacterium]NOG53986.1 replication-associated recombination protein A [Planctomycetota bacterium]
MPDLWDERRRQARQAVEPLAVRMRPRTLDEFAGQQHFLGPGQLLRRILAADRLTSVIFFGPPGTGKTALAEVIALHTQSHFERANAALVGVKDIRRIMDEARRRIEIGTEKRTVLFLDEIHRFNRAQQDVLLNDVERGLLTLIGATTENPYFAVNAALVSRSTLFRFEPLSIEDVEWIIRSAIDDPKRGYGRVKDLTVTDEAIRHWAVMSDGDARRALSALEVAVLSTLSAGDEHGAVTIDLDAAQESIQRKAVVYDGSGDEHYDIISAFIKSMRGSDPDAAVYWLARMLDAGEDPRFIARRIAILASEDIGNADPRAIQVAAAAFDITERIGMPECQLTLAQAAIYMSVAPKSNASCTAILSAMKDVREGRTVAVPAHLRDAHYKGAKQLGHGTGYEYAHGHEGGVVSGQHMGIDREYYHPTENGLEARIAERLAEIRRLHRRGHPDE